MKSLPFWLGMCLFAVYLLSFSHKLHVMDEFVGYAVGNNWVQHGRPDVNQFIWTNHWHSTPPGIWGIDHNLYTKKAPGISLAATPLIWLGHNLPGLNAIHLSLLLSAIVTAATGSLLLIWLAELGISRPVAALTALIYGLGTIAWVYARFLWEHSLMAFLFLLAAWALWRAIHRPNTSRRWVWVLLSSLAATLSLTMRFEAAMAVALFGAYTVLYAAPLPPRLFSMQDAVTFLTEKTRWLWAALYGLLPAMTLLWLLYFNAVRFGSAGETGYNREILFQRPWEGAFGLLFSPSTGMFIYMPVMMLLLAGLRPAWRRLPHPYFWLLAALTLFYWIFYGAWFSWGSTWVWGPRFMLHTLPLLMLPVAEVLDILRRPPPESRLVAGPWRGLAIGGAALLVLAGFVINFLGVAVDLNEHFLRLGRNDNYVFNWAAFAPLGHWQILREGLVDVSWLQPTASGLTLHWNILLPPLALLLVAIAGLVAAFKQQPDGSLRNTRIAAHPVALLLATAFAALVTLWMMRGTAQLAQSGAQAQADAPLLQLLAGQADDSDSLLISMPPYGDVLEITSTVMGNLHRPLPTYAWIESEPRAIQPDERERIWQAVSAQSRRVWLFERWLTPADPLSETAARARRDAYPTAERWLNSSGRLTLVALPGDAPPAQSAPLNVPFAGGLSLLDFAVEQTSLSPGDILRVRLNWQAAAGASPSGGVVAFVHLLNETGAANVAQHDRLLVDAQQPRQSALLPGQTAPQGYGLQLPANLPPGSYPLIVGLYTAESGQRLPRTDGSPDDFLYLTNITVN